MKHFKVPGFLVSSNIYEVNTRQYTREGTFAAFMQHLPRLKTMGVEILWFMPVHPIGVKNRKGTLGSYYSIKNFYEINPEFGTLEDFKAMIILIHKLGMRIIMDWVANHAAWDNIWTVSNPDFFEQDGLGNFKSPYDWTDVIQINHSNPGEQDAMIAAMSYWVREYDIDGFRADLAHLTPLSFWVKARQELAQLKQDLIWLAETEEPAYHDAFDISYTWKWMHATEEYVKGDFNTGNLVSVLNETSLEFRDELRMYYTSNHDENSWNGSEYDKYGIYARAFAVFANTYFLSVPLIYSGQEMPCKKRLSFFDKDEILWDVPDLDTFYTVLLHFRKREPLFQSYSGLSHLETTLPVLAYMRSEGKYCMIVVLNISRQGIDDVLAIPGEAGVFNNIFTNELIEVDQQVACRLEAGGYLVLDKINP